MFGCRFFSRLSGVALIHMGQLDILLGNLPHLPGQFADAIQPMAHFTSTPQQCLYVSVLHPPLPAKLVSFDQHPTSAAGKMEAGEVRLRERGRNCFCCRGTRPGSRHSNSPAYSSP
jgi:hypothetical protein